MKFSFHDTYVKDSNNFRLDGDFESYANPLFPDFNVKNEFKEYLTPGIDYELDKLGLIAKPKFDGFPIFLTHDIDYLNALNLDGRIKKLLSNDSALDKKVTIFLGMCRDFLHKKKFRTYEELVSLNIEKKRIATYFMVSDRVKSRSVHDAYYKLHKNLDFSSGYFNIGIHGQWQSHRSHKALSFEIKRLESIFNKPISSCRYHHLFFNKDITPKVQLKSGINFDFTLGFNMINGYRRKSAIPIVVENTFGKIIQIPTLYQDIVELRHGVMNSLDPFIAIDHCSKFGFPFTLLWHNCWEAGSKQEIRIESILDYAISKGGFFTTPEAFFGNYSE